ncbi:hypothetical protein ABT119_03905 [Streptomyces sp. NPDC001910]|uniref:hypothetical protein n=1 Tax=Streptomyces sp. NPDC001910 TaxID=3154403 RepID=UPI00331E6899
MEVLGDVIMKPRSGWVLGCALIPAICLTGCTTDQGSEPEHTVTTDATHRSAEPQPETRLTAQAQEALDAVTKADGSMVESGAERVSDGVHTQPDLADGTPYKLTVVCAGEGAAEIAFTPHDAGSTKSVPCDGSVVFERFTGQNSMRLDVQGKPSATGMIVWRINKV